MVVVVVGCVIGLGWKGSGGDFAQFSSINRVDINILADTLFDFYRRLETWYPIEEQLGR